MPGHPASMRSLLALAAWLGVSFVAAGIGAVASAGASEFYAQLERPSWAPPGGVFAPVWTTLYTLMGIAAWLVWREPARRPRVPALTIFLVQLVVNALWSWLFFAWRMGAAAFVEALVLLALVAATVVAFWRVRPLAGALLLPCLAWVAFACALTFSVWKANPDLLG